MCWMVLTFGHHFQHRPQFHPGRQLPDRRRPWCPPPLHPSHCRTRTGTGSPGTAQPAHFLTIQPWINASVVKCPEWTPLPPPQVACDTFVHPIPATVTIDDGVHLLWLTPPEIVFSVLVQSCWKRKTRDGDSVHLVFIIPFDFASKDNKGEFWTKCQYGYASRFLFFFFC